MIRFLHAECVAPEEIHRQSVVYGAHTMSRKQAWIWCNYFDNCRIDADDKQRRAHPRRSVTYLDVCSGYVCIRKDRCTKVTSTTRQPDISPGSAHKDGQLRSGLQKTVCKLGAIELVRFFTGRAVRRCVTHLTRYAKEAEQFPWCASVTGDGTWIIHWHPKPRKQPWLEINITTSENDQSKAINKDRLETCLFGTIKMQVLWISLIMLTL